MFEKIQTERRNIANQVLQEKTKLYEQNQLAKNLNENELSLNHIKSEKQRILSVVKKDKNLLKEIQQEKSKLQKQIQTNLQKIEQSKSERTN